jgi:replicative DNA helicase
MEYEQWQQQMEQVHGIAEAIIGKQRHGPTGTVQLSFEAQFTRFGNLAHDQYLPERYQ